MAELKIIRADGKTEYGAVAAMRGRAAEADAEVMRAASDILESVRKDGIEAVQTCSMSFDGAEAREIAPEELRAAYDACGPKLRAALEAAAANIRAYHERMKVNSWEWDRGDGRVLGQRVRPLSRVGLYVPGGAAAYPSTVLMNAIPARVAGVPELVMATPPGRHLNNAVLAAAYIAGVDRVFAVGGVQAIGALAYGAGFIPKVDKIVGPGNVYVAAAKRLVFGTVDIDMIAGPSEILVIADGSADPAFAAADLLSQAEHAGHESAILLATDMDFAQRTAVAVATQALDLPRRAIIEKSIGAYGAAIVCDTLEHAAELANEIAPEHLEIMTESPRALLPLIRNAGAVFLGPWSPEPLGDYMAGPSHVLPTSGSARFASPLSVDSFLKKMSVIEYGEDALRREAPDILELAGAEGLSAHANSIRVRL